MKTTSMGWTQLISLKEKDSNQKAQLWLVTQNMMFHGILIVLWPLIVAFCVHHVNISGNCFCVVGLPFHLSCFVYWLVTKVPYRVTKVPFFRYKSALSSGSLSLLSSLLQTLKTLRRVENSEWRDLWIARVIYSRPNWVPVFAVRLYEGGTPYPLFVSGHMISELDFWLVTDIRI